MGIRSTLFASLLLLAPSLAAAQGWPTKPVHILVSSGAGGTADILARMIGERLAPMLGQPVIVENRPGAGGHLGAGLVARAQPDGYTLLMSGSPTHSVGPHLFKRLSYEPMRDVPPVAMVAIAPNLLVTKSSLPVKSLADLVALAREKPGQLTYSSAGNGTSGHLAAELLKSTAKLDMRHVPYKSGPEAVTGVLSGDVDFIFFTVPAVLPQVEAGKLRALPSPVPRAARSCRMFPRLRRRDIPASRSWAGTPCSRPARRRSLLSRSSAPTSRRSSARPISTTRCSSLEPSRDT